MTDRQTNRQTDRQTDDRSLVEFEVVNSKIKPIHSNFSFLSHNPKVYTVHFLLPIFVTFSSGQGDKNPDSRIFLESIKKMDLNGKCIWSCLLSQWMMSIIF